MQPKYQGTFNKFGWWMQGTILATPAEADAVLAVTERTFQDVKALTNVVYYIVAPGISALDVRFSLLADDDTADIDIWEGALNKFPGSRAEANDPTSVDCELQRIATLDVVASTHQGVIATDLFADTINVSNGVSLTGIGTKIPGANQMAAMGFALNGANVIVFHGYGTFDSNCKIWLKGYAS